MLARFGKGHARALSGYRQFIADGVAAGRRNDLIGGGLKRSLHGQEVGRECVAFDERILGSGDFVENLTVGSSFPKSKVSPLSLEDLLQKVCEATGVKREILLRPGRVRAVAKARAIFCCLSVQEFGYTGKEAGMMLGFGSAGVSIAVRRGAELLKNDPTLLERITGA